MSLGLHTRMSLHAPNTTRDERNCERSQARRPNTPSRGGNRRVFPRQFLILSDRRATHAGSAGKNEDIWRDAESTARREPSTNAQANAGQASLGNSTARREGDNATVLTERVTAGRDRQLLPAHRPIPTRIAILVYAIGLACAIALVVLP
jgi:hypothetical protein